LPHPADSIPPHDPKRQALCIGVDAIDDNRIPTLIHASDDLALKR
jgi:hypothetical protein